jgi:hypothetical protein
VFKKVSACISDNAGMTDSRMMQGILSKDLRGID